MGVWRGRTPVKPVVPHPNAKSINRDPHPYYQALHPTWFEHHVRLLACIPYPQVSPRGLNKLINANFCVSITVSVATSIWGWITSATWRIPSPERTQTGSREGGPRKTLHCFGRPPEAKLHWLLGIVHASWEAESRRSRWRSWPSHRILLLGK